MGDSQSSEKPSSTRSTWYYNTYNNRSTQRVIKCGKDRLVTKYLDLY